MTGRASSPISSRRSKRVLSFIAERRTMSNSRSAYTYNAVEPIFDLLEEACQTVHPGAILVEHALICEEHVISLYSTMKISSLFSARRNTLAKERSY